MQEKEQNQSGIEENQPTKDQNQTHTLYGESVGFSNDLDKNLITYLGRKWL